MPLIHHLGDRQAGSESSLDNTVSSRIGRVTAETLSQTKDFFKKKKNVFCVFYLYLDTSARGGRKGRGLFLQKRVWLSYRWL